VIVLLQFILFGAYLLFYTADFKSDHGRGGSEQSVTQPSYMSASETEEVYTDFI